MISNIDYEFSFVDDALLFGTLYEIHHGPWEVVGELAQPPAQQV